MTASLLPKLRTNDYLAYIATLLAPSAKREALAAVWCYSNELALVPLTVQNAAAGEIRLQWWAEVVRGVRNEEGRGHPVGRVLLRTIDEFDLPREPLADMAEARSFDLYIDPMPDRDAFEAYAGAVASVPIQVVSRILDADAATRSAEAAGHAGVYQVVIDRLWTLARDRASGRSFLPSDVLLRAWTTPTELTEQSFADQERKTKALVEELLAYADTHRAAFEAASTGLPPTLAPAFAAANARKVREKALRRSIPTLFGRSPNARPVAEQREAMRTHRLFETAPSTSLLGRLRKRLWS